MMRCEEADGFMDDYIDETLDDKTRAALETHIRSCDMCTALLNDLRDVQRRATALEDAQEPERDLWPEIRMRIEPRRIVLDERRRRAPVPVLRYVLAAAALVAIVFGLSLMPGTETPEQSVVGQREITEVESEYQKAKTELLAALDTKSSALDPETLATIQESLVVIESALADIQLALNDNPGNPDLERMLYAAYRYEVELLHQAIRLADEG